MWLRYYIDEIPRFDLWIPPCWRRPAHTFSRKSIALLVRSWIGVLLMATSSSQSMTRFPTTLHKELHEILHTLGIACRLPPNVSPHAV